MPEPAATTVVVARPVDEVEIIHRVCCKDDNLALCGEDVTTSPWNGGDAPCISCEHAMHADLCPVFGRCIDPEYSDNHN